MERVKEGGGGGKIQAKMERVEEGGKIQAKMERVEEGGGGVRFRRRWSKWRRGE